MKITWKLKTKILKKIKWEFIPLVSSWKCSWKTDWVLPRLCKKLGLEIYSIFSDYAHFLPFLVISCRTGKRRRSVLWHLLTLGPDHCCGLRAPLKPLLGPEHPQNVISILPWETITTCSDEKAIENHTIFFPQHHTSDNEIA